MLYHSPVHFPPYQATALVPFTTDAEKKLIAAGTHVNVVEGLPLDSAKPEAYIVEVSIPDRTQMCGFRFDTATLRTAEINGLGYSIDHQESCQYIEEEESNFCRKCGGARKAR